MIQWLLFMSLFWASLASSCEDLSCEPPEKLLQVIRDLQQKLKKYHHADGGIYVDPNMGVSHARLPRSVLMQDASAANNTRHPNCPPCPPSACDSNPCLNGGTCLVDVSPKSNNYKCDCPPNFAGKNCEKEIKCDGKKTCGDNAECFVSNRQTNCVCKRGYTKGDGRGCLEKVKKSCLWGDPHYTTFDQLKYDYQGTCPYVLSQPCGKLTNGFSNYTVVAKNELVPHTAVSRVNEVEVTMHDQQVHLDRTTRKVYFNGNVVSPPYYWPSKKEQKITVTYVAETFFVKNDELVEVKLTNEGQLCVQVPDTPEFRGKGTLCGLAGNIDGSYKDDIVARDGSVYTVTKSTIKETKIPEMAKALDTWITKDFRQLRNDEQPCIPGIIIITYPDNCDTSKHSLCKPIFLASKGKGPFGPCEKMGWSVLSARFASCRFDMCRGDNKCKMLSDFVKECMSTVPNTDLGAWREQVKCELTCPLNSHYSSCKSSCPATCAESIAPDSCDQPCSEGCTCDDGYVVDNTVTSKLTCIPIEDCGCTDENGNSFPAKRAVLSYDCQVKSQCMNGSFTSEPNKCSTDGFCGTDASSDMACLCLPGFAGDGYTCTKIDQCQDPRSCNADKKQGTCRKTAGSYHCDCNKFYDGSDCQYYHPRRHCADLYKYWGIKTSGVYTINPPYEMGSRPALSNVTVYCDMDSDQDGVKGGWTLMTHDSGSGMVNKTFNEYELGFGTPATKNVWLGLQIVSGMTQEVKTSLLLNLHRCAHNDLAAKTTWCKYRLFSVAGSANNYAVTIPEVCKGSEHEYYDGWARWDLSKPGPQFTAYDTDKSACSCSDTFRRTGWWFDTSYRCGSADLNGVRYSCDKVPVGSDGATYLFWSGSPLRDAWLSLRPTAFPNYDPHPVTPMN